jgi:hypothetical protein
LPFRLSEQAVRRGYMDRQRVAAIRQKKAAEAAAAAAAAAAAEEAAVAKAEADVQEGGEGYSAEQAEAVVRIQVGHVSHCLWRDVEALRLAWGWLGAARLRRCCAALRRVTNE